MVKNSFLLVAIVILLASCSSLKPLQFNSNKQAAAPENTTSTSKKQVQFLDEISVTPAPTAKVEVKDEPEVKKESTTSKNNTNYPTYGVATKQTAIENATDLQLKYSVMLNTEVELLQNTTLLAKMDEWYGTRYRMGGTTKKGVDCSALVQAIFLGAYAVSLPRTAREQYQVSRRISRTELKEGDLLFFNTTGGISHVGIYLQNNKFIHASASKGVTISDLFDPYYVRRFVGAGRVEEKQFGLSSN
ncbi:MAG TPA: NlpC/P60 family protein [Chitinophagaceae bacterium]